MVTVSSGTTQRGRHGRAFKVLDRRLNLDNLCLGQMTHIRVLIQLGASPVQRRVHKSRPSLGHGGRQLLSRQANRRSSAVGFKVGLPAYLSRRCGIGV